MVSLNLSLSQPKTSSPMFHAAPLVRGVYQITGLIFMLISIPLAFDVGGTDCGISFTCLLSLFYAVLCTLRLGFRRTVLRGVASFLYATQVVAIPSMLLLHLATCAAPEEPNWLSYITCLWRTGLDYATGPFSILEGFCALIVVQVYGRVATVFARRSDTFLLVQLVLASLMISADIYLLARIYWIPDIVGVATATLIGAALTICLSLGTYGIWSRRGGVVESTLLFSYVVYQIYLTFTDFQDSRVGPLNQVVSQIGNHLYGASVSLASTSTASLVAPSSSTPGILNRAWSVIAKWNASHGASNLNPSTLTTSSSSTNQGRMLLSQGDAVWAHRLIAAQLPPVIIKSCAEFMKTLAELTPTGLKTMFEFLVAAMSCVTPSVCISLVVRLAAYFIAMRLVPYIKHDPQHYHKQRQDKKLSKWVLFVYSYSPILIIMVYTHLLLQHAGHIVHAQHNTPSVLPFELSKIWTNSRQAWQFWGWANVFVLLALYGVELTMAPADSPPSSPIGDNDEILEM